VTALFISATREEKNVKREVKRATCPECGREVVLYEWMEGNLHTGHFSTQPEYCGGEKRPHRYHRFIFAKGEAETARLVSIY